MKTLLYLDQPFVSNLCKSRQNHPGIDPTWRRFDQVLRQAVTKSETVICPASPFHEEEASLDSRLADGIHRIVFEYSGGVSFLRWAELLDNQARRALYTFCDHPFPEWNWNETFDSDPHESLRAKRVHAFGGAFLIDAGYRRPVEFINEHRESKQRLVEELEARTLSNVASFEENLKRQKESFISARFLLPATNVWRAMSDGRFPSLVDIENADSVTSLLTEFKELTSVDRPFGDFLFSGDMFHVPFIDVFCSLYAALEFHAKDRKPRGSDFDDVPILATAIPYCRIVTMDTGMKDLCAKARLHERYAFESYCPKTDDVERLIERLASL